MNTGLKTDLLRFWQELRRRRVVRVALFYVAFGWVVIQVADVLFEAFDLSQYVRFVVAGVALAFPLALALAWVFDITPGGIERTPEALAGALPVATAPDSSLAVLPFANLGGDAENEYFSDGLTEEIRNQLARVPGLRVAARTSSFAFKDRHDDVREIGRRLNVAAVLEGGVRRQADTVRINLQLVSAHDGFQLWSDNFERRLEDIFRLQDEIASAVTRAVSPLSLAATRSAPALAGGSFEAYNLYLLGRHHFHKRREPTLARAVDYFQQSIALDPGYAPAHAGLADAHTLLSSRYYGNVCADESVARAMPAATRALELAPGLAEAHASMGLVHENRGDLASAEAALTRAIAIDGGYTMARVWYGLVLLAQGRFRDAGQCNREAFALDPLSPIINTNVAFDAMRFGALGEAAARFGSAIEIDPAFPVPYYGLSCVQALQGQFDAALGSIRAAIERAPSRAYYRARHGLLLLQTGDFAGAAAAVSEACCMSPGNPFDADLVLALHMVRDDHAALARIAEGGGGRAHSQAQRAQAWLALGDHAAALREYEAATLDRASELVDLVTDDWIWRLPHVINRAHLRLRAGDPRGREELLQLREELVQVTAQGVVNPQLEYWAASASAVLGEQEAVRRHLGQAERAGWRHDWWAQRDWNLQAGEGR